MGKYLVNGSMEDEEGSAHVFVENFKVEADSEDHAISRFVDELGSCLMAERTGASYRVRVAGELSFEYEDEDGQFEDEDGVSSAFEFGDLDLSDYVGWDDLNISSVEVEEE